MNGKRQVLFTFDIAAEHGDLGQNGVSFFLVSFHQLVLLHQLRNAVDLFLRGGGQQVIQPVLLRSHLAILFQHILMPQHGGAFFQFFLGLSQLTAQIGQFGYILHPDHISAADGSCVQQLPFGQGYGGIQSFFDLLRRQISGRSGGIPHMKDFVNDLSAVTDRSLKHFVIPCVGGKQSAIDAAFQYSGKQQRTRRGQVSCEKFCDRILNHVGNNIVNRQN